MSNIGMMPSHPGEFVHREVLEPLGLNITEAAEALGGVCQDTLSDLLNGKVALSPEMALRLEKAFKIEMDFLLRMQALYDTACMRQIEEDIDVVRFQPE